MFLVKIGFLPITIWDLLDIAIVGFLMFRLYKLLKGSLAFNIFIGVIAIYIGWWLVDILNMSLLSMILGQFVNVGVILLLIIFQPEVRRFLLLIGRNTLKQRPKIFTQLFKSQEQKGEQEKIRQVNLIAEVIGRLSKTKTGALMLFSTNANVQGYSDSGVVLDADVSIKLIESIFQKESPLHDGAAIITDGKIYAASCILPVSDSFDLPENAGLRHRAAVGATEETDVIALVVSEETGNVSYARHGKLFANINKDRLKGVLRSIYKEFFVQDKVNEIT